MFFIETTDNGDYQVCYQEEGSGDLSSIALFEGREEAEDYVRYRNADRNIVK